MKRICLFLCLLSLVLLAGCSGEAAGETTYEDAPELTIKVGDASLLVEGTAVSWRYDAGGGRMAMWDASLVHPLARQRELTEVSTDAAVAVLSFEEIPDSIQAEYWSDADWGDDTAPGRQVSVSGNTLPLQSGGWIYAVSARWDRASYGGVARYCFYIIAE